MSLSKNELVSKLEEISALHRKAVLIKAQMNDYEPDDNYIREVLVPEFPGDFDNESVRDALESAVDHTDDDAVEQMGDAYDKFYHPKEPVKPIKPKYNGADTQKSQNKQAKFRRISGFGLFIAIFFFIGLLVGTSDTPEARPTIIIIAAIGLVAFILGKILAKKEKAVEKKLEVEAQLAYDELISSLDEQYKDSLKAYSAECDAYIPIRQSFIMLYSDWRDIYLDSEREEEEISMKLESERRAFVEKMDKEEFTPILRELTEKNDLVANDYLPVLDDIIELLTSGRADDLKEAINLYEEIAYRERELQFEREREEQRRYEEEQRRRDEERRHREDMAQRESEERQRRRDEEQRRSDEERRHREDMAQREKMEFDRKREEDRRRQEERRKAERDELERKRQESNATRHQCNTCALNGRCSMSYQRPNCASYRPR